MWVLVQVCCVTLLYSSTDSASIPLNVEQEPSNETHPWIDEYMEPACAALGGICAPEASCPEGQIHTKGQCPQRQGFECCHAIPSTRTTCQQNGGECFDSCRDILRVDRGSASCLQDEYCCLLL